MLENFMKIFLEIFSIHVDFTLKTVKTWIETTLEIISHFLKMVKIFKKMLETMIFSENFQENISNFSFSKETAPYLRNIFLKIFLKIFMKIQKLNELARNDPVVPKYSLGSLSQDFPKSHPIVPISNTNILLDTSFHLPTPDTSFTQPLTKVDSLPPRGQLAFLAEESSVTR